MSGEDVNHIELIRQATEKLLSQIRTMARTPLERLIIAEILLRTALDLIDESVDAAITALQIIRKQRGGPR